MEWINAFLCFRQQRVVVNGVKSDWAPVVSGVPQGTVLGPLLFSLYINDIPVGIDSQIRLFADDCVCYREIKTVEDTLKLQKDNNLLGSWARKCGMRFQPVKCNMMQLTNKRINKIEASYTLEGTALENVDSIKYIGVTITGLKGKARIPTEYLILKALTRRCRNAFQPSSASIEAYKCSFFPQTIRDWNDLPDSLLSTAEMSDDCVSKFASLVRSRD